ncbi:expressed unknown protein [Seminavis robusta]|nr:expressed unknown protein [Seminavis robusta]|eukprot:Sro3027_g342390.1 n/a (142) ;mRNA; f:7864-8289
MPAPISEEEERSIQSGDGIMWTNQEDMRNTTNPPTPPLVPMASAGDSFTPIMNVDNAVNPSTAGNRTNNKKDGALSKLSQPQLFIIAGIFCGGCLSGIILLIFFAVQSGKNSDETTSTKTSMLRGRIVDDDFYRNNDDDFY